MAKSYEKEYMRGYRVGQTHRRNRWNDEVCRDESQAWHDGYSDGKAGNAPDTTEMEY